MASSVKIKVDPEFASLCPPLSDEELFHLRENIKREGVRDPLVVWKDHNVLLDGHNRKRICDEEAVEYRTVEVELPDRDAARAFVMHNQLGRRNLTPEAASYLRGRRYLKEKAEHGGRREASGQSDQMKTTAQLLGEQYHVGEKTIRRDGAFAEAVDEVVENCGVECRGVLLGRQYDLKRGLIMKLVKLSAGEQKQFFADLKRLGVPPRKKYEKSSKRQVVRFAARKIVEKGREHALAVFKEMAKLLDVELPKDFDKEAAAT